MQIDKKTLRQLILGVMACIILYWVLTETERVKAISEKILSIFSPFILGAALSFILNVPMRGFEAWLNGIKKPGLRRAVAILLTVVAFVLVVTVVFLLLIPQIGATIESLGPQILLFVRNVEEWINGILRDNPELMAWLYQNTGLESIDWGALVQQLVSWVGEYMTTIVGSAASAIGSVTGAVVNLIIALVFALYCLTRKEILARQGRMLLYAFLPEKWADEIIRVLRLTNSTFSNFLSGQCLEVCILGSLFAVSMAIFQMPYIPLVSVLVAVTAFIPVIGAFAGCIFGAFFILVDDPLLAVGFVVMFLILQQIENNLIYPRVVGESIGLPGMWVLVAVMLGGELMGAAGMFLMIPLVSVLYTLLSEITGRRLEKRGIDVEKLRDHPPELHTPLREKRTGKKLFVKRDKQVRQERDQNKADV